jgi:hypothetical protein
MTAFTTMRIYRSDAEKLQRVQRAISAERDSWVSFADLIHELIESLEARNER